VNIKKLLYLQWFYAYRRFLECALCCSLRLLPAFPKRCEKSYHKSITSLTSGALCCVCVLLGKLPCLSDCWLAPSFGFWFGWRWLVVICLFPRIHELNRKWRSLAKNRAPPPPESSWHPSRRGKSSGWLAGGGSARNGNAAGCSMPRAPGSLGK